VQSTAFPHGGIATPTWREFTWRLALILAITVSGTDLRGQQASASDRGPGWMLGGTLMVPPAGAEFSAVGLIAGTAKPVRLGTDLAIVVIPRTIASGLFAACIRANLALPVPLGRTALLIPSAGVSLLGAGGAFGFTGTRGYNGTIAIIGFGKPLAERTPSMGIRVAYAAHEFGGLVSAPLLHVLEIGIVRRSH
jgi:hypothetical protein